LHVRGPEGRSSRGFDQKTKQSSLCQPSSEAEQVAKMMMMMMMKSGNP